MLTKLEIGYVRSFLATQTISLAIPNGTNGSGYNVVVGKNNSGKSTVVKFIRELLSNVETLTISSEARHEPNRPHLALEWTRDAETLRTEIDTRGTGGYFQKRGGDFRNLATRVKYIPSRRAFASEFQSTNQLNPWDYEHQDYTNRRNNISYVDNALAASLAQVIAEPVHRERLKAILTRIDPRVTGLDADNIGGRDVIRLQSASGRWHIVSDAGDGIVNVIRIIHAIVTSSNEGSCIIIDEPELSLHPQLQRTLYDYLIEVSARHQVIVVTHSPHFVSWVNMAEQGGLVRLYLDASGWSQIRTASRDKLAEVRRSAHANVTNRKYFDAVCKELFFADEAVLLEGPDDVHYISNYLESIRSRPLPLVGYGCGGAENIPAWMALCQQLGIKSAAIYDANKRQVFELSLKQFSCERSLVTGFLLSADDIRDKYERDARGRETANVISTGIFRRDGTIHEDKKLRFDLLVASVRAFLDDE